MTNNHETTGEPSRIETLAAEYPRRAATLDRRSRDLSRNDTACLAEPLDELVATPATTARASADHHPRPRDSSRPRRASGKDDHVCAQTQRAPARYRNA